MSYRDHDDTWTNCEQCGEYVKVGGICPDCGRRTREGHTHMARSNGDAAAHYAVIADNIQWADDVSPFDRRPETLRASVEATKAVAGLE
jgi:ribosomal protein L32